MQVSIEKLIYGGAGLARTDQGVVFVAKTVPGDVVTIDIHERKKGYAIATLRQIITPSEARKLPSCPNFDTVGCCHWDHIEYSRQVEFKKGIIRESLSRLAKFPYSDEIHAITGVEHGYRMRASFHVRNGELAFVRENTNAVVPIIECAALTDELNGFIPSFNALKIPAARVDVVSNGAEIAATVHFESFSPQEPWERWRDALFSIPSLVSLTFLSGGKNLFYRKRNPVIEAGGTSYQLTSDAFFQANRFLLQDFAAEVVKSVGPAPGNVLELFSGSGFFSIPIGRICRQLIGVENNAIAVRAARRSAQSNRVGTVEFVVGDVARVLTSTETRPDVVLLNPPRTGAGTKVASDITALKAPRIVYVSCNPTTLAPDLKTFVANHYRLTRLTMVDQFPDTYHIEIVATFELE